MSPKTLIIAAAALAASSAAALPALAAPGDATQQNQDRPVPFRASIMFNLVDQNGDGAIDATEAAALQKAIFGALDANKDGKLTPDEFRKVADGFMDNHPRIHNFMQNGGRPGFGMRHPGFGPGRQGQLDGQQGPGAPQLGQNDDGQQPPNGVAPMPRDFASLDKNGDGVISPDELAAGMPMMPGIPVQP